MPRRLSQPEHPTAVKGRGAPANPAGRFETFQQEAFDDGWGQGPDETEVRLRTHVTEERGRSILSYNDSPDVRADRTINPYRGCEHGCIYCFARPTHGYLGLSSGLDFETRLTAKVDAPRLLDAELRKPSYRPASVLIGANTDCYQPIERKYQLTRQILQILVDFRHPFVVLTKNNLVLRDLDLLTQAARLGIAQVCVSVTTLDREVARKMEPRAATPEKRLEAIRTLALAGVPVGVLAAPMIPGLTDHELEGILAAAAEAGANGASYVLLRLPHEIKDLFQGWLQQHHPGKAQRVLQQVRDMRGGQLYQSDFGTRMHGTGLMADLLAKRFQLAAHRLGLDGPRAELDASQFRAPGRAGDQLSLL